MDSNDLTLLKGMESGAFDRLESCRPLELERITSHYLGEVIRKDPMKMGARTMVDYMTRALRFVSVESCEPRRANDYFATQWCKAHGKTTLEYSQGALWAALGLLEEQEKMGMVVIMGGLHHWFQQISHPTVVAILESKADKLALEEKPEKRDSSFLIAYGEAMYEKKVGMDPVKQSKAACYVMQGKFQKASRPLNSIDGSNSSSGLFRTIEGDILNGIAWAGKARNGGDTTEEDTHRRLLIHAFRAIEAEKAWKPSTDLGHSKRVKLNKEFLETVGILIGVAHS